MGSTTSAFGGVVVSEKRKLLMVIHQVSLVAILTLLMTRARASQIPSQKRVQLQQLSESPLGSNWLSDEQQLQPSRTNVSRRLLIRSSIVEANSSPLDNHTDSLINSESGKPLEEAEFMRLLARYYWLKSCSNETECNERNDPSGTIDSSDANSRFGPGKENSHANESPPSGQQRDPIQTSLPRPTNLSVLILSWYPPLLELSWQLNEFQEFALDRLDFYAAHSGFVHPESSDNETLEGMTDRQLEGEHYDNDSRESKRKSNGKSAATTATDKQESEEDDEGGVPASQGDSPLLRDLKLRRVLINKALTCFQVTYSITNSRFKVIEEYPPYLRSITMERLLPATEYTLRVAAIYLNKYELVSDQVQFISPTDNESRRFKENTYRPIHRYPDEKRPPKIGLEQVRNEELTIVAIAICFWFATIYWFFNKWGKIRMLEPYQPAYRESSTDPFGHHQASLHNLSQAGGAQVPGPTPTPVNPTQELPVGLVASLGSKNLVGSIAVTSPVIGGTGIANVGAGKSSSLGGSFKSHQLAAHHYFRADPSEAELTGSTAGASAQKPAGTIVSPMQDDPLTIGKPLARRASRSLLLLGQKRFETMGDEFPAGSRGGSSAATMNYLFQKKAQTLARATTLWTRRQNQLNQFRAACLGPTANDLELFARAASPSGGLRCRNRASAGATTSVSSPTTANGHQRETGLPQGHLLGPAGSLSARQALMRLVHARTLTVESTDSYNSRGHVLRNQQTQNSEHDHSNRSSVCSGATGAFNQSFERPASSCEQRDSLESSQLAPINVTNQSASSANNPNNKMRRLLFMNRSHQNHQLASSSSSLSHVQAAICNPTNGSFSTSQTAHHQQTRLNYPSSSRTNHHPDRKLAPNTLSLDHERACSPVCSSVRHSISGSSISLPAARRQLQATNDCSPLSSLVSPHQQQQRGPEMTLCEGQASIRTQAAHHILIEPPSPPPSPLHLPQTREKQLDQEAEISPLPGPQQQIDEADEEREESTAANFVATPKLSEIPADLRASSRVDCDMSAARKGAQKVGPISDDKLSMATLLSRASLPQASFCPTGFEQHQAELTRQPTMSESGVIRSSPPPCIKSAQGASSGSVGISSATQHQQQKQQQPASDISSSSMQVESARDNPHSGCKWQSSEAKQITARDSCHVQRQVLARQRLEQPEICLEEALSSSTSGSRPGSMDAFERLARYQQQHLSSAGVVTSDGFEVAGANRSRSDFGLNQQEQLYQMLLQLDRNEEQDRRHQQERPRMGSMFAASSQVRNSQHRDSYDMLRVLSQKKSKSAEDIAYLSSLVLQIWVSREQNPLLQSVSSHQLGQK